MLKACLSIVVGGTALLAGCRTVEPVFETDQRVPSNNRNWRPDLAILPYAEFEQDRIQLHNIRNCSYATDDLFVLGYYDKSFRIQDIQTVDFILVPFKLSPSLAHTMLSFGLADGSYIVVSAEVRKERGETYAPVQGAMNKFELMYVIGDERDLIKLRTAVRQVDVYLYRAQAEPEQVQAVFVDALQRANQLKAQPEFYHTITNNCTTNIVRHVNRLFPGRIPKNDLRTLLPGLSDSLAYDLGLLETGGLSFQQLKARSRINEPAREFAESPDFSQRIRQRLPFWQPASTLLRPEKTER